MKQTITLVLSLFIAAIVTGQTVTKIKGDLPFNAYYMDTDGTFLYVANTQHGNLQRYNLSNLNETPETHNIFFSQNKIRVHKEYLYFASYSDNKVVRRPLNNLGSTQAEETILNLNRAVSFLFDKNYLYAIDSQNGIFRYDMTNNNPETTKTLIVSGSSFRDLRIIRDTIYFVDNYKLYKKDLISNNTTDKEEIVGISFNSVQEIEHRGNYLYISQFNNDGDIIRYDLLNNAHETFITSNDFDRTFGMFFFDDKLYFTGAIKDAPYTSSFYTASIPADEYVYVPDTNFEQALIDAGHDSGSLNGFVPTANVNTVTTLSINNKSITNLQGIEAFTNLETLSVTNNNIKELNIEKNVKLTNLNLTNNELTNIDVSKNTALKFLFLTGNNLKSFNVGTNTNLETLFLNNNELTTIEGLSLATALNNLELSSNKLTNIDLSNNSGLLYLYVNNNEFTTLDFSANNLLEELYVNNNPNLTALNIKSGGNSNITDFNAANTPNLNCIQVDDVAFSTTNWTSIDPANTFSENCATASVEDLKLTDFSIYPNPSTHTINIKTLNKIKEAVIYSILGEKVLNTNTQNIDISKLNRGIYLIKVTTTDDKVGVKRFVKK